MKEQLKSHKDKLLTGTALMLASIALVACAEKESDSDDGSAHIAECPQGYSTGAQEVTGSREEFRASLGEAVTTLTAELPGNTYGDTPTQFVSGASVSEDEQRIISAAVEVFHQEDKEDGLDIMYFESDNPENRIDDLSEQFCTDQDKLYVSPQTATAIGAMEAAGIIIKR